MRSTPSRQGGMALIIGLILLIMITLVTVASFNIGKSSMESVGNMQQRDQVLSAANMAIQEAISTIALFTTPADVFSGNGCGANTRCIDVNDDGTDDITVQLTPNPFCVSRAGVPTAGLVAGTDDCVKGAPLERWGSGGLGSMSGCGNSIWEIRAVASDNVTGTTVTVTQGAVVFMSAADLDTYCP